MIKFKTGDELYVNDKFYWDIIGMKGDKLVVQMYYKSGFASEKELRTANFEIPMTLISFESKYREGVYKVNIKPTELKQIVGGLMNNLIQSPDVYSMVSNANVTVNENVMLSRHIRTIDKTKLDTKGNALLAKLEKVEPDKYSNKQWKDFSAIIGVPYTHLIQHIFEAYNHRMEDEIRESYVPFVAKFDDYTKMNKLLEDGVACVNASSVSGMGAVADTPAPTAVGVPSESGSDIAVTKKKKKEEDVATKENNVQSSFADLGFNKKLNSGGSLDSNFIEYGLVKMPKDNMRHINLLMGMQHKPKIGGDANGKVKFPSTPDEKAIGDENVVSPKPASFSDDTHTVLNNLIYHKFGVITKLLHENAGNEDAVYKERVYKFFDFPWNGQAEQKVIKTLNAERERFLHAGVGEIKSYLKRFWETNKSEIEKSLSDDFISDYMVLTDIQVAK